MSYFSHFQTKPILLTGLGPHANLPLFKESSSSSSLITFILNIPLIWISRLGTFVLFCFVSNQLFSPKNGFHFTSFNWSITYWDNWWCSHMQTVLFISHPLRTFMHLQILKCQKNIPFFTTIVTNSIKLITFKSN